MDDRAPVPALINGEVRSLSFSSELDRTNYLNGGVTLQGTYDDNVLSLPSNPVGGYTAAILPYIAIDQSRSRLHWNLNYAAGFVANQRLADQIWANRTMPVRNWNIGLARTWICG